MSEAGGESDRSWWSHSRPLLLLPAVAVAALLLVVWFDSSATRSQLLELLRDQAASLRGSLGAAARSNREAGRLAEQQLSERLLDNARLLAELDARSALSEARLARIVEEHHLFRASLFDSKGRLERSAGGPPAGRGHGPGGGAGPGAGFGGGGGAGPGGGAGSGLLPRLLEGEASATSDLHPTRWGEGARLAAGARRSNGGAIILNVDAGSVAALRRQSSLDSLLSDLASSVPEVAFVVFRQGEVRLAHGSVPAQADPAPAAGERFLATALGPALEFSGPLELGDDSSAWLQLGMKLDGLKRAERRMLGQLAFTLAASLAVAGLGVGTVWLRRKYSLLSARHARAEEALRRRDRLSAMGELASTVAHEIRNPLNAIAMSGQRLSREFADPGSLDPESAREMKELVEVVSGESKRIERIVRQFLDFARPPALARRPTELAGLAGSVVDAARPLADSRGVVLTSKLEAAGSAELDSDRLREALGNLLRNAIEATPERGQVELAVSRAREQVAFVVTDTGHGIPEPVRHRIFDLYFTTKPDGTGVGLALTHQVVTAHDGTIEVESEPGTGTRMTVRLPARGPGADS